MEKKIIIVACEKKSLNDMGLSFFYKKLSYGSACFFIIKFYHIVNEAEINEKGECDNDLIAYLADSCFLRD